MMVNRTLLISALFFSLVPWCLGLGNAPQKPEQDIHVSQEVKIKDQEKQEKKDQEKQDKKPAADQENQDKQPGTVDTEKEKPKEKARAEAEPKAKAEDESEEMMLNEEEALLQGEEAQFYTRKDRVDPFEPFLRKQESEGQGKESGEELDRRKPQTPLEKIALSQLRLTAIIHIPGRGEAIAMVEDQAGKGYTVKEGTYIGENGGQVVDILEDRLIIKEKYKDVYNKIAEREIEKKLQK